MTFLLMVSVILMSILFTKCDQSSDLWQQLGMTAELKSDLQDNMEWGKKWLVLFD